jgi:hypothetical protein
MELAERLAGAAWVTVAPPELAHDIASMTT